MRQWCIAPFHLIFLVFIFSIVGIALADPDPAAPYTKEGMIGFEPSEACRYKPWPVLQPVPVYKDPNINSKIVFNAAVGDELDPFKEHVLIKPGIGKVLKKFEGNKFQPALEPGTELILQEYVGEGSRQVWYEGQTFQMDIYSIVYETPGVCYSSSTTNNCWLSIQKEPKEEWWAYVRSKNQKKEGWIRPDWESLDICNEKESSSENHK